MSAFHSIMRALVTALLLSLLPLPASANAPEQSLAQANSDYLEGGYGDAIDGWSTLVEGGAVSGDLLYNIGNAHYRQGELAKALLSWRRAALLSPRDGDIRANIDRARSERVDLLDDPEGMEVMFWRGSLSMMEQAWLSALFLAALGALLIARRARGGRRIGGALPVAIPALLLGLPGLLLALSSISQQLKLESSPEGVVLVEQLSVRSAGAGGVVLFELHAAAEVEVRERVGEVWLIEVAELGSGWVPGESIGLIDPSLSPRL